MPNLFEFASGGDPHRPDDPARHPTFEFTREPMLVLCFSHRRRTGIGPLAWRLESTADATSWQMVPGEVEVLSTLDHGDGTETVRCRHVVADSPGARFFRLRIEWP